MATLSSSLTTHGSGHAREVDYINATKGIWSWMTTVDHKRIGIMYLVMVMANFLVGGLLALLLRLSLLSPDHKIGGTQILDAETYNRVFTLHGAIMVFLFVIPSIPAAIGNFVLPVMLGAKDVAFPRLNLLSFYVYMVGAAMAVTSIFIGAVDTGWTFYTPYSTSTNGAGMPCRARTRSWTSAAAEAKGDFT